MEAYNLLTTIGIATTLSGFLYVGKKLQILDDLQKTTHTIKHNLKVVTDYLIASHDDFNHQELRDYSPLKLTKKGQVLIRKIGFDRVFDRHQKDFFELIESEAPRLKYDVEKAAIRAVVVLSSRDYMKFLKVYVYNHPERNIRNLAPTLGVYVRDKYLAQHPQIIE